MDRVSLEIYYEIKGKLQLQLQPDWECWSEWGFEWK